MKKGFSLAEVLIIIGIIGIIAGISFPVIQQKIKRRMATVHLKRFYSMMKQMLLLAEQDYGTPNTWKVRESCTNFIATYITPYIKGAKGKSGCTLYFDDGSSLTFDDNRLYCMDITYDVNADKLPNKVGYDKFIFLFCAPPHIEWCPDYGFCSYRHQTEKDNRSYLRRMCSVSPPFCSALLEYDRWEFLSDYPYKL